ncbi:MAG: YggS family pyridoxal phosphate-dependent enzyme [Planctomycetaceae bacterium]|jgi:pyridoxal phosphate enzyme (YggS family)|nr:YggS family pyridoxal phosphate-dependent enzyme [Planctomycetaceae bacterium]
MPLNDLHNRIAANVAEVRQRIDHAAVKSGRKGTDVRLTAVSKYVQAGDAVIDALTAAGCSDLGESRPQVLLEKYLYYCTRDNCMPIRWHLIGTLQRNKVRKILPAVCLIHSLDSVKLAEAVHRIAEEEHLPPVHCLLETFISRDADKRGIAPESVLQTLDQIGSYPNIVIDGLMGMSGLQSEAKEIHREFALLRTTAEHARQRGLPPNVRLSELSMGMSGDFEIAVEEGATIVRIGSFLYQ